MLSSLLQNHESTYIFISESQSLQRLKCCSVLYPLACTGTTPRRRTRSVKETQHDIRCNFPHPGHIRSVCLICGEKMLMLHWTFIYTTLITSGKGRSSCLHESVRSHVQRVSVSKSRVLL